jgi:hypothetical protein
MDQKQVVRLKHPLRQLIYKRFWYINCILTTCVILNGDLVMRALRLKHMRLGKDRDDVD